MLQGRARPRGVEWAGARRAAGEIPSVMPRLGPWEAELRGLGRGLGNPAILTCSRVTVPATPWLLPVHWEAGPSRHWPSGPLCSWFPTQALADASSLRRLVSGGQRPFFYPPSADPSISSRANGLCPGPCR